MTLKILIVEDDEQRMANFRHHLPNDKLTFTSNVPEAISMIKFRPFDVIFMDYDLDKGHEGRRTATTGLPLRTGGTVIRDIADCGDCVRGKLWVIHSLNDAGATDMMVHLLRGGGAIKRWPHAWEDPALDREVRALKYRLVGV